MALLKRPDVPVFAPIQFGSRSRWVLWFLVAVSAILFFISSSLKHTIFQSHAWDLGIFDQAIYLIAQGQAPISSFLGFHILGDHAAFILYPLALLYKIYPSVYWLLGIQAIALASGMIPTWLLARQAGLSRRDAGWISLAYIFYPVIFSINQFDFHPDVFVPAALLWAIWGARSQKMGVFCSAIVTVLCCKAVLGLTIAMMGLWLFGFDRRRKYGLVAIIAGLAWFVIGTQMVIPFFGGANAMIGRHLFRYGELGDSFSEVAITAITKPWVVIGQIVSKDNLRYLFRVFFPVIWGIMPQYCAPLLGALPAISLNLLSVSPNQKDLIFQYSLPVLPFLLVSVIATMAVKKGLSRRRWLIVLCLSLAFVRMSAFRKVDIYFRELTNVEAKREAIALVQPNASVLTVMNLAPHLTHRSQIRTATIAFDAASAFDPADLPNHDAVLLDMRYSGYAAPAFFLANIFNQVQADPRFQSTYQRDGVYLFTQNP
jgi:uncharacterized membrane protein